MILVEVVPSRRVGGVDLKKSNTDVAVGVVLVGSIITD